MLYWILAAVIVIADQIVKALVRAYIPLHIAVSFLPGFDLTYVRNTGAAFSILNAHTWMLAALSAVVSVILAVALAKKALPHWTGMLALALLLGGAVGNLIDRAAFGFVTDMFATTFMNFPVFNVADIGVTVGGALLCVHVILFYRKERKEETE